MTNTVTLPAAAGDFAAFFMELFRSIRSVTGTNGDVDPEDQLNHYVRPTAPQLTSWRAVFQSLLAGDWDCAHVQARMISETYNVVQFLDIRTGRTYYVLMEGVPGDIPAAVNHPSGSVTITDPADSTRRGWGTYVFDPQPQRALSFSAPHLFDCFRTEVQAVEAFLGLRARTLLLAGTDRDQNTADSPCDQAVPRRPFREADVCHTAESIFQIAFEEIYSSDASTWHLQFHGNATCQADVFLSNGVEAARDIDTFATLYAIGANIAAASTAAAAGGPEVLTVDVYDGPGDCPLRGRTNMQMRFASGQPHASICHGDVVGPSRFIHVEQSGVARLTFRTTLVPRQDGTAAWFCDPGDVSASFSGGSALIPRSSVLRMSDATGAWVEDNIEETLSFYRLPRQHHKHLKSTNIKRRTHVRHLSQRRELPAAGPRAVRQNA